MNQTKEHYSYRIYADPEVARTFDEDRFGGNIGDLIKQTQAYHVFSTLPDPKGWKVIDVGAGTGRMTIPFLERGASVAACDASEQMLEVLRTKVSNPELETRVIDAHDLPFPERNFDCALSFRMLLHVIDWKKALSELCRVSKDWVVIDLPPKHGFLRFAPVWHSIRKIFSERIQTYRVFPLQEVESELATNGFRIEQIDPGFFLPLAVYRTARSRSFMRSAERLFAFLKLTPRFGSPFTIFARRTR
jgi:SAM-dependent methyltransferase